LLFAIAGTLTNAAALPQAVERQILKLPNPTIYRISAKTKRAARTEINPLVRAVTRIPLPTLTVRGPLQSPVKTDLYKG
jgi:hypothetical protein